jgi:hypothetical protein
LVCPIAGVPPSQSRQRQIHIVHCFIEIARV